MRLLKFMKEDVTTDALELDEPEVGKKYSDEYVEKRVSIIQKALKKVRSQAMNDEAKEAIMADLNDKLDKWENVEKETKAPEIPAPKEPPAEEAADPEEQAAEEDAAKEEEKAAEDQEKEEEDKLKEKEEKEKEKEKKREKNKKERESASESRSPKRLIKTKIRMK